MALTHVVRVFFVVCVLASRSVAELTLNRTKIDIPVLDTEDWALRSILNDAYDDLARRTDPIPNFDFTPNGPVLHGASWACGHSDEADRVLKAFTGTLYLAREAVAHIVLSMQDPSLDSLFTRYFPLQSKNAVFKVFRSFFDTPFPPRDSAPSLAYRDLLVYYGDATTGSCSRAGVNAFMTNGYPEATKAALVFCPRAFTRFIPDSDLPRMVDGDKDESHCEQYTRKGYAWEQLNSLSGLIMHESLHYNGLIARGAVPGLSDFVTDEDKVYITDFNDGHPVKYTDPNSGYGPYNAQRLRAVDGGNPAITLRNVDNYLWYAIEVYWNKLCTIQLGQCTVREAGTQPEWKDPTPPETPAADQPADYLLPRNWKLPEPGP